jgi:hypothetical protein
MKTKSQDFKPIKLLKVLNSKSKEFKDGYCTPETNEFYGDEYFAQDGIHKSVEQTNLTKERIEELIQQDLYRKNYFCGRIYNSSCRDIKPIK